MDPKAETPHAGPDAIPRKQLSRRSRVVGGLLAVLVLGGTGWLTWHLTHPASPAGTSAGGGPGGPGRRPSTTVGVATAERAHIPVVLDALGTVTPLASVKVTPRVSGVMQKVLFKEGQMVRAGDLLASIDPQPFELALRQASGERQRDEAQLDSARVTLKRYQTLLGQDSIARQEVDTQAALVKQLEGTVMIDKANEDTARLNVNYTRVLAPVSGRVGLRTVDAGNVVNTSDANGIALITQLNPISVVFAVPQDQAGALQQAAAAGTAMKATALDRTRTNVLDTGMFASLDNQVDTTTGTVKAKARFDNAALALFPSQFVNVRLQLKIIENAVVVPVTALRHGNDGDYVYVLNAEKRTVSLRPVTRGQATVDKIALASGLAVGEQVITEGADQLKDGAHVVLAGDAPAGPRGGASQARAGGKQPRASNANDTNPAAPALPSSAPAAAAPQVPLAPQAESPAASAPHRSRPPQASGS